MSASTLPIIRRPAVSAFALICAAQFVLQLDFSIVNVALPSIQRELGFVAADLQWVVTGYALTFGSLLLLGGRAGDLLGRRRLLLLGLTLFALASLTCGPLPAHADLLALCAGCWSSIRLSLGTIAADYDQR